MTLEMIRELVPCMTHEGSFVLGMEYGGIVLDAAKEWLKDHPEYLLRTTTMSIHGKAMVTGPIHVTSERLLAPGNDYWLMIFVRQFLLNQHIKNE